MFTKSFKIPFLWDVVLCIRGVALPKKNPMISSGTSLLQIAEIDEQAVLYLQRFGIPMNETTRVEEINQRLGFQSGFVESLLNNYCLLAPACPKNFSQNHLPDLLNYLKDSHHFYNEVAFPHINRSLENILFTDDPAVPAAFICQSFIQHYAAKLSRHFQDEEKHLFPLAEKLIQNGIFLDGSETERYEIIKNMQSQHDSLNADLQKIHEVMLHYRAHERHYSPLHAVLHYMAAIQRDIQMHEFLEDEVLMGAIAGKLNIGMN
jgi:iron-sulfur cluster repair protein YtfE (RIC family)